MYQDKYIFPAIFIREHDGKYSVSFPDFDCCVTYGNDLNEAMLMAKDVLEGYLWGLEDDNEQIPTPSLPEEIKISTNEFVVPIFAYMLDIRNEMNNKAVNENCTLPRWLLKLAEENKLNLSQVLQTALKERLNIKQ
ncbi:MAG: type II toxin-antitoxin system HicB family antitoxin [Oscillospiraceae bacterium]|nr:type II toxin-antitoxin system HicB family antitoxin [Oscillospiraceae bacterium]